MGVRCCLKEGRKHGIREEKKESQTEGTVVMLSCNVVKNPGE